jgi:hypothetical protein
LANLRTRRVSVTPSAGRKLFSWQLKKGEPTVAKQSKWLDVNFAPGGFRNYWIATVLTKALPLVEEAAYNSMLKGDPHLLVEAVEGFSFPDDFLLPMCPLGVTYEFDQAPGLARIAELLWFLHAPSKVRIKAHAKAKKIPAKAAKEEVCKRAAQNLRGSFTHAWRLYDADIHKRMSEAIQGFVNEVVAQTIWEVPGTLNTKLKRGDLYKLAISDEENARRERMKFGPGGSQSDYNLRWFPTHYSTAYRQLSEAAGIDEESKASPDKNKREHWRERIKEKFPDLDGELIARLTGQSSDLTDEHIALLIEHGGDSTPSNIALEQAARWCGIERYRDTKRGLHKHLETRKPTQRAQLLYSFLVEWHSLGEEPNEQNLKELISKLEV